MTEGFSDPDVKKDIMSLSSEELETKYNAKRIAMCGHVQVKVKGTISKGQRLVLSDVPGVARAITDKSEKIDSFAIARQNYDSEEVGLIEVRLIG